MSLEDINYRCNAILKKKANPIEGLNFDENEIDNPDIIRKKQLSKELVKDLQEIREVLRYENDPQDIGWNNIGHSKFTSNYIEQYKNDKGGYTIPKSELKKLFRLLRDEYYKLNPDKKTGIKKKSENEPKWDKQINIPNDESGYQHVRNGIPKPGEYYRSIHDKHIHLCESEGDCVVNTQIYKKISMKKKSWYAFDNGEDNNGFSVGAESNAWDVPPKIKRVNTFEQAQQLYKQYKPDWENVREERYWNMYQPFYAGIIGGVLYGYAPKQNELKDKNNNNPQSKRIKKIFDETINEMKTNNGNYSTALKKLSNIMEGSLYNPEAEQALEYYKSGDMVQYQNSLTNLKGIALLDFLELAKQQGLEQEINSETISQNQNPVITAIYRKAMMIKQSDIPIGDEQDQNDENFYPLTDEQMAGNQAFKDMGDDSVFLGEDTADFDSDDFYNDLDNSDTEKQGYIDNIKNYIDINGIELDYARQLGYSEMGTEEDIVGASNYIDEKLSTMNLDELSLEYNILQNRYK